MNEIGSDEPFGSRRLGTYPPMGIVTLKRGRHVVTGRDREKLPKRSREKPSRVHFLSRKTVLEGTSAV